MSGFPREIAILGTKDPQQVRDGGTLRLRAFQAAYRDLGVSTRFVTPADTFGAPLQVQVRNRTVRSRLSAIKRHWWPMPTAVGARSKLAIADLRSTPADLVLISSLSQTQYAALSETDYWLDFMDIWSEVAERESSTRKGPPAWTSRLQSSLLRTEEQRVGKLARVVTSAGWLEHVALERRGIANTWLPTPLPDVEFERIARRDSGPSTLGFIGNFHYWPNVDALNILLREWMPQIVEAGWRVLVAGLGSEGLRISDESVIVLGEIADVNEFYSRVDAVVAPIQLGGGIKVKVVESLSRGKSVISSAFGLDGLPPEVARYVTVYSGGAFPALGALPSGPDPNSPDLRVFSQSWFSTQVQRLMADFDS